MPDPSTLSGLITYLLYLIPIVVAILMGRVQLQIQVKVQTQISNANILSVGKSNVIKQIQNLEKLIRDVTGNFLENEKKLTEEVRSGLLEMTVEFDKLGIEIASIITYIEDDGVGHIERVYNKLKEQVFKLDEEILEAHSISKKTLEDIINGHSILTRLIVAAKVK